MLTPQQEKTLINMIPQDTAGEYRRAAYAVITGIKEDKSANQIASYYSITNDLVTKWYDFFALDKEESTTRGRKSRKGKDLTVYVKSNLGKTVTPKMVSEDLGISLPTFYNFYNANRGYFKKVKRGEFEIISPEEQRVIAK